MTTTTTRRRRKANGQPDAAEAALRLAKALAHPIRVAVLEALTDGRTKASPSGLAEELGEELGTTLPTLSYHVRELLDAGLVVKAGTRPARGAVEHHYRVNRPLVVRGARELERVLKAVGK